MMCVIAQQQQQKNWTKPKQRINMKGLLRLAAVVMLSGSDVWMNSLKWNLTLMLDDFLEGPDWYGWRMTVIRWTRHTLINTTINDFTGLVWSSLWFVVVSFRSGLDKDFSGYNQFRIKVDLTAGRVGFIHSWKHQKTYCRTSLLLIVFWLVTTPWWHFICGQQRKAENPNV